MLLYLLRHGDALESGDDDASRPLSPLGEEQAMAAANTLIALHLYVEIILSSPLVRAKQTAECIRTVLRNPPHSVTEYLTPGTHERQLFRQLSECGRQSALLVGHEPHLREFTSLLISGSRHSRVEVRKGTMLCLETSIPVGSGSGGLKWMLTSEQMKRLVGIS
ncbi:MAG TPA: phosphohistidine phosphatase SixA [Bacteroidota bacterium]|jgi:phosphohistidine phosphatase|nr:phosphohistidine phosphatase SixA [Bacteroidota bacterium]